ncbi:MAG TPA: type II toxin-antitoxin system RelE/ParE family toxin [Thermoanaerobaculia bacterium]|nr:type II toxin-antitoxin system RelE/ParE family toxin [Thermoanaerobaculia bacterium]
MLCLKLIARGAWTLYAVCSSDKRCPLEEFLADQSEFGGDKDRMLRRMEEIAVRGPYYLPDISHQIEGEIRQTEQGRVRVLWFFDKGRLILCSHGFIKSSQKTPEREKGIARRAFEEYHAAKATGSLVFLEE